MLNNPVLHKEMMRMRMRQGKPARIAILTAVALGIAYFYWVSIGYLLKSQDAYSSRAIWTMTVMVQFLLIGLLTPSATANAISQEREQQTWDMLLQTRLTGKQIIFGKLLARLTPSLAIILLGLPVTTFCVLTGLTRSVASTEITNGYYDPDRSVSLITFLLAHVAMLVIGAFFATFGLYMSMKFKRTLYALLATYGFIFGVLGICTVMLTGMLQMFNPSNSRFMEEFPLMWLNPVYIACEICGNAQRSYAAYATIGLLCYAAVTVIMLSRLVVRFRSLAIER